MTSMLKNTAAGEVFNKVVDREPEEVAMDLVEVDHAEAAAAGCHPEVEEAGCVTPADSIIAEVDLDSAAEIRGELLDIFKISHV